MTDNTPGNRRAVGIKYQEGDDQAPVLIAKGFGELAEEIIAVAKANGVLVHEDPYLSEFLSQLELGQDIPKALYHVIAELIAFSYVLQGKFPQSWAKQFGKVSTEA
ncbi:EscU/YscU/HrcU family type III secretion system export apparatus switch protein [Aestuariibacter halophilus]|uniref:Flagellar biosynthetic protein FlhB n=1 Tax=Fluctibacter halophilus TaxID=226011 RepID=A0ABS8G2H6_9ALTE|nr:EscU/YscU/HrcU family type III secretion system export apparatus switch protein [Aestuariibacter halophilus]MCC2614787.1 EscU/YscU/HrcU family type III secretion system export apparatus switch protein [Aestuariibacter halophilus]